MGLLWWERVYVTAGPVVVLATGYALAVSWRELLRYGKETVDHFINARGSSGAVLLGFSFFASVMGCWAATAPSSYAASSGLLGLAVYALSVGVPLFLVARLGASASKAFPESTSLSHFLQWRFACAGDSISGRPTAAFAVAVMLFNMVVMSLVEYATLAALFRDFVGVDPLFPLFFVAVASMCSCSAGGLQVSLLTNRFHALAGLALVVVLTVYLSLEFRVPQGLPPLNMDQAGLTFEGYSSLLAMPCHMLTSCLFSEAVWQRVWAAKEPRALTRGAAAACVFAVVAVLFFGFVGFLSLWAMRAQPQQTDSSLYLLSIFKTASSSAVTLSTWTGVLTMVCLCLMSGGVQGSLQSGMVATVASNFLRTRPVWVTRTMIFVMNLPLVYAANYITSVLEILLLAKLFCACWLIPFLLCLSENGAIRSLLTEASVLFGGLFGILSVTIMGAVRAGESAEGWLCNHSGADWFAAALGGSLVGVIFGVLIRVLRGYCDCTAQFRYVWIEHMLVGRAFEKDIDDAPLLRQAQFVQQFSPTPSRDYANSKSFSY